TDRPTTGTAWPARRTWARCCRACGSRWKTCCTTRLWSSSERHARGVMIYFIQDTVTRAIKIGYSTNPQKRLKNLQNSNQNKLVLLYAMHGELEHEAELLRRA